MSKIIELYGMTIMFCMFVFILIGVIAVGVYYLPINSASNSIVEIIEVNEGMNDDVVSRINEIENELSKITINISDTSLNDDYKKYEVQVTTVLTIPIINLQIPLTSTKSSKRVLL